MPRDRVDIQAYRYVIIWPTAILYGNWQPVGLSCSVETVNKALSFFTSPVVVD